MLRRFTVEVLVGNDWRPTPYQQLTEKHAQVWARWYRGQGKQARLVRVEVAARVVH